MHTFAFKESDYKAAQNIWHIILFSFLLDGFIFSYIPGDKILPAAYAGNLSTAFLVIALILSSKETLNNLLQKMRSFQFAVARKGKIGAYLFYSAIGIFVFAELFSRFGFVVFQNLILVLLFCAAVLIAVGKTIVEKKKHDHLMKHDRAYFNKQQMTQNLIFILLPSLLCRFAAFFAVIQTSYADISALGTCQYILALFLFIQASPAEGLK